MVGALLNVVSYMGSLLPTAKKAMQLQFFLILCDEEVDGLLSLWNNREGYVPATPRGSFNSLSLICSIADVTHVHVFKMWEDIW